MVVNKFPEVENRVMRRVNKALATDPDLDGVDLRVYLFLTSILNFDSFTVVTQSELAEMMGRRKEHLSRSMHKLEARGVIVPGSKVGRSLEWRLNPNYRTGKNH